MADKRAVDKSDKKTILIVEDDIDLASLWQKFLQSRGYVVDVCGRVDDAEIVIAGNRYDLLIVDIFFREGNTVLSKGGITLINRRRLRESTESGMERIKIIAITGTPKRSFGQFDALDSVARLSDLLQHKPIRLDTLAAIVEQVLSGDEIEEVN